MSLYKILKAGYRRFFPKSVRHKIYIAMPSLLKVFQAKIIIDQRQSRWITIDLVPYWKDLLVEVAK